MDGVIPALKDPHKSVTVRPPQTPFQLVSRGPPSQSAQAGGKKGLLRGGVRPRGQPSPAPRCSSRFYSQEQSLGAPPQCWDSGWPREASAFDSRGDEGVFNETDSVMSDKHNEPSEQGTRMVCSFLLPFVLCKQTEPGTSRSSVLPRA